LELALVRKVDAYGKGKVEIFELTKEIDDELRKQQNQ
jgi:hypothetical protein